MLSKRGARQIVALLVPSRYANRESESMANAGAHFQRHRSRVWLHKGFKRNQLARTIRPVDCVQIARFESRWGANTGLNTSECLDDIEKYRLYVTDAHVRITESETRPTFQRSITRKIFAFDGRANRTVGYCTHRRFPVSPTWFPRRISTLIVRRSRYSCQLNCVIF